MKFGIALIVDDKIEEKEELDREWFEEVAKEHDLFEGSVGEDLGGYAGKLLYRYFKEYQYDEE